MLILTRRRRALSQRILPQGTNIGSAFTATDVDSGHTLTYSLGGTDAGSFGFDTNSRQLQTAGALNFEGTRSYSVTITVTDGTLTDMVTVTINVTGR